MTKPVYVEFCAGLGGTRAGLKAAGWHCAFSLDSDEKVVSAHRAAFGDCEHGDVRTLDVSKVPPHDLLVAGFPCQPFSSSGLRTGFSHDKGHVFQAVARICAHHRPRAVLLENVRGLLSNAYGHTFASVLKELTSLGYAVTWGVLDAARFGVPQSRLRVFIIGTRGIADEHSDGYPIPNHALGKYLAPWGTASVIDLDRLISERQPRVGLRRPDPQTPFGVFGVAAGSLCWTWADAECRLTQAGVDLGDIVCPNFEAKRDVRSVRYWGHSGVTKPYFKTEPLAHCIGTNIGAGPTFGIEAEKVKTRQARAALLEYSNWVREDRGYVIFRLVPSRASLLFGPHVDALQKSLAAIGSGVTKQYEMLGNLVAPAVAQRIGEALQQDLAMQARPAGGGAAE
jgi:site-specific DNA-cytosine methylase